VGHETKRRFGVSLRAIVLPSADLGGSSDYSVEIFSQKTEAE